MPELGDMYFLDGESYTVLSTEGENVTLEDAAGAQSVRSLGSFLAAGARYGDPVSAFAPEQVRTERVAALTAQRDRIEAELTALAVAPEPDPGPAPVMATTVVPGSEETATASDAITLNFPDTGTVTG